MKPCLHIWSYTLGVYYSYTAVFKVSCNCWFYQRAWSERVDTGMFTSRLLHCWVFCQALSCGIIYFLASGGCCTIESCHPFDMWYRWLTKHKELEGNRPSCSKSLVFPYQAFWFCLQYTQRWDGCAVGVFWTGLDSSAPSLHYIKPEIHNVGVMDFWST